MRALMIMLCTVISAWCAVIYARSTESVAFSIAGSGLNYSHPNALTLGGAVLFGLFAIALAIEGLALAKKAAQSHAAPQQPQVIIVPPWQTPPQCPSSESGNRRP